MPPTSQTEPEEKAVTPVVTWPSPDGGAPPVEITAQKPLRGRHAALVILAVTLFALSDVFAKQLSGAMPPVQVTWIRYILFFGVALAIFLRAPVRRFRPAHPVGQFLRGVLLLASAVTFILGLHHLPVAEATAISFVAPVFITLLAIPLLGEVVRVRRWAALGLGLVGVLIVMRPGTGAFQPAALYPMASALCGALSTITTRKIGSRDGSGTTLLWSAIVGLVVLSVTAPFWWTGLDRQFFWPALAMGGFYALGQYSLVIAYSEGDASMLAPFSYAQVLVATGLGAVVFGNLPDAVSLGGIALVIASGAYTLYREGVLPKWERWPKVFLPPRRKTVKRT